MLVRCVDITGYSGGFLKKHAVYRVTKCFKDMSGQEFYKLDIHDRKDDEFFARRFEIIVSFKEYSKQL